MEPWIHIPYANLLLSVLTMHLEKLQGNHFLHYLARNYQELQTFKNSNILFHSIDFNFFQLMELYFFPAETLCPKYQKKCYVLHPGQFG